MVHDHFLVPLAKAIAEWELDLAKITPETRSDAYKLSKLPIWQLNVDELVVILARELPHVRTDLPCDWDPQGFHMLSPRKLEKGVVKLGKFLGSPGTLNFKDVVFLLTRDALAFAQHCRDKRVFQICFSPQCFAPAHLVLADHAEILARRFCCEHPEQECPHEVVCLRGDLMGPLPPPTPSARDPAREFIDNEAVEVVPRDPQQNTSRTPGGRDELGRKTSALVTLSKEVKRLVAKRPHK